MVNWKNISMFQIFSDKFLVEFKEKINWYTVTEESINEE
jgi:hypothetical protein